MGNQEWFVLMSTAEAHLFNCCDGLQKNYINYLLVEERFLSTGDRGQPNEEIVEVGGHGGQAIQAFRTLLGETDMMAYLSMMAPRPVELTEY